MVWENPEKQNTFTFDYLKSLCLFLFCLIIIFMEKNFYFFQFLSSFFSKIAQIKHSSFTTITIIAVNIFTSVLHWCGGKSHLFFSSERMQKICVCNTSTASFVVG